MAPSTVSACSQPGGNPETYRNIILIYLVTKLECHGGFKMYLKKFLNNCKIYLHLKPCECMFKVLKILPKVNVMHVKGF